MKIVAVFILLGFTSVSFAQKPSPIQSGIKSRPIPAECKAIANSCDRVNTAEKNSSPKDVFDDCLIPIINGKTVKGVRVPPAVLKTCRSAVSQQEDLEKVHHH